MNSGYILKVESMGFADGLDMRSMRQESGMNPKFWQREKISGVMF